MAEIRRFSKSQVAIHALAAFSILILYVTGLPITFPQQLGWIPALMGGYPVAMLIHRIAASGFIIAGVYLVIYHGLYDVFIGRSFFTDVWPRIKDIEDAVNDVKHILRIAASPPRYAKYSWIAKAEFWSFFSEAVIFLITGSILWFSWQAMAFMPPQYLLTARYIHAAFAVVSVCGVAFHSYMVHFNPEKFSIDRCIFTGTMSEDEVKEKYPQWHEELTRDGKIDAE